jgi:DGQHR domain-containing protein
MKNIGDDIMIKDPDTKKFDVRIVKVTQPLGDFYIASIPAKILVDITDFDVRRVLIEKRDVEKYLGIQRPLDPKRVKEISDYVNTVDACFPTGVIVSIPAKCVSIDDNETVMTISNYIETDNEDEIVIYKKIARVLDGQHRLAGLKDFEGQFEINVSIFVDMDISDQANIFSTVNLAQTKVQKSLAYDLYDVMKARSPQKTCHNIAVTLDREEGSPFKKRIKRLGVATPHRTGETLTQSTFIEPLLKMISTNPMRDRDFFLRHKIPPKVSENELNQHPFQHMFVDGKDFDITDIVWNYFEAVSKKWNNWNSTDRGVMLNRTNGYRALMRFLNHLFNQQFNKNCKPSLGEFQKVFNKVNIDDNDFNVETFPPGSSGEGRLFRSLVAGKVIE